MVAQKLDLADPQRILMRAALLAAHCLSDDTQAVGVAALDVDTVEQALRVLAERVSERGMLEGASLVRHAAWRLERERMQKRLSFDVRGEGWLRLALERGDVAAHARLRGARVYTPLRRYVQHDLIAPHDVFTYTPVHRAPPAHAAATAPTSAAYRRCVRCARLAVVPQALLQTLVPSLTASASSESPASGAVTSSGGGSGGAGMASRTGVTPTPTAASPRSPAPTQRPQPAALSAAQKLKESVPWWDALAPHCPRCGGLFVRCRDRF